MRARGILVRRVLVYMLILAVLLTALITFLVLLYTPVGGTRVTLVDKEPDGKANEAVVVLSTDGPGKVEVTVILKDAEGTILDSGSTTVTVPDAGDYTVIVPLNNVAVIDNVKSIAVMFTQVQVIE